MKLHKWIMAFAAVAAASSLAKAQSTNQASPDLAHAKVFSFDTMNLRRMPNGGESRDVVQGKLATGEGVSIHESMQPAGLPPNPAHSINHSEFILVTDGTLEYEHVGKVEIAGPGSVIYVAYGTMHKVRNIGQGPAKYTVIAIGGDVSK